VYLFVVDGTETPATIVTREPIIYPEVVLVPHYNVILNKAA
jgi:hypothetical protein